VSRYPQYYSLNTNDSSIIRATCVFDTKFDGFFGWPISLSAYKEMNKKNFEISDFCSEVPAYLVEKLRIFYLS